MATVTKTFTFASNAEGFVANNADPTTTTLSWSSTVGNPAGSLAADIKGRNKTSSNYWEWTGTWEALGVPAGGEVTSVRLTGASTRVSVMTHSKSTIVGPYTLLDSGGTQIGELWAGRTTTTQESSWTATGAQSPISITAQTASNSTIKIRLADTIASGNNNSAETTANDDQVAIEITYTVTVPPTAITASDSGTISAVETVTDIRQPGGFLPPTLAFSEMKTVYRAPDALNSSSINLLKDDIIIIKGSSESNSVVTGATATGLTFSKATGTPVSGTATDAEIWTATAGSDLPGTVVRTTWTASQTSTHSMLVEVWRGGTLVPSFDSANATGNTSGTFSRTAPNAGSVYSWVISDWNANNQGKSAVVGNTIESYDGSFGVDYSTYYGYSGTTSAGSLVLQGIASANSGTWSWATIEIRGKSSTEILFKNASDSGTISATDSSTLTPISSATPKSSTDSGTISATESSSVVATFSAISKTDSGTISATEASSLSKSSATTDAGTISATESSALFKAISSSDSGTLSATESRTLNSFLTRTDVGTLSATETLQNFNSLQASDTGTIGATESRSIIISDSKSTADAGTISAQESSSMAKFSSHVDSGTISASETSFVFKVIESSDSGTLSASEDALKFENVQSSLNDSGTLSAVETSSLFVFRAVSTNDSGTISATESASGTGTITAGDSGTISATETTAMSKYIETSDNGTISATETSNLFGDGMLSDSGVIIATETASVEIFGTVEKVGVDSGVISALETASTDVFLTRVDSGTLSAQETYSADLTVTASDSSEITATEEATVFVEDSLTDGGVISATETVEVVIIVGTPVKVWDGSAYVDSILQVWDGAQFITPAAMVWDGANWS